MNSDEMTDWLLLSNRVGGDQGVGAWAMTVLLALVHLLGYRRLR